MIATAEKTCTGCGQVKPLSDFHRSRLGVGGRAAACKVCRKAKHRDYHQQPEVKERMRQWARAKHHTPEGQAQAKRKDLANRQAGKVAARKAVSWAVKKGRLPPVKSQRCGCGRPAVHYHHFRGYSPANRLDVIPLCGLCHAEVDGSAKGKGACR